MAKKEPEDAAGTIKVRCPKCLKALLVKAEFAGRNVRCPLCSQAMAVPAEPEAPAGPEGHISPEEAERLRMIVLTSESPEEKADAMRRLTEARIEPPAARQGQEGAPSGPPAPAEAEREAGPEEKGKAPEPPGPPGEPKVEVGASEPAPHHEARTRRRVAEEEGEPAYELSGGTLRVAGEIGYDLNPVFRARCRQLLEADEKELSLDLSKVFYLSSAHLGVLEEILTEAKKIGKTVSIRASDKAARTLRLAGFEPLAPIEVVQDE